VRGLEAGVAVVTGLIQHSPIARPLGLVAVRAMILAFLVTLDCVRLPGRADGRANASTWTCSITPRGA
jgi:hypothetical protein